MDRLILRYSDDEGYSFALIFDDPQTEERWKDTTFWEAVKAFEIFLNVFQKRKKEEQ